MPYRKIRIYVDGRYLCSTTHAPTLSDALNMVLAANMVRVRRHLTAIFADQDTHPDRPKGN